MDFEKNKVTIVGKVVEGPVYSHNAFGESFYSMSVLVERLSHTSDIIPVIVPAKKIDQTEKYTGNFITINGNVRSCYRRTGIKNKKNLKIFVFANEFSLLEGVSGDIYQNDVELIGTVSFKPVWRRTPSGRKVADMELFINCINNEKSYKIICICWGLQAKKAANEFRSGDKVYVSGRFQSREYEKNSGLKRVFEISITNAERIEEK